MSQMLRPAGAGSFMIVLSLAFATTVNASEERLEGEAPTSSAVATPSQTAPTPPVPPPLTELGSCASKLVFYEHVRERDETLIASFESTPLVFMGNLIRKGHILTAGLGAKTWSLYHFQVDDSICLSDRGDAIQHVSEWDGLFAKANDAPLSAQNCRIEGDRKIKDDFNENKVHPYFKASRKDGSIRWIAGKLDQTGVSDRWTSFVQNPAANEQAECYGTSDMGGFNLQLSSAGISKTFGYYDPSGQKPRTNPMAQSPVPVNKL